MAHLQSVNHQKEVSVSEALGAVREFAGNIPLVCHNVSFDKLVLENEISKSKFDWKIENQWICTLELARKRSAGKFVGRTPWRSDGRSYALEHVAKQLGIEVQKEKLHSGFYDAAVAGQVYLSLTSGAPIQTIKFQASPEPKVKAGVSLQFGEFHEKLAQLPGVYQFSFGSNQFYIGSSSNVRNRYVRHCRNLLDVNHPNKLVQRAFNERGADPFDFRVVRYVTNAEEAASLEANLIEKLREEGVNLFNLTADGGSRTGLAKDPSNPIAVSEWREKSGMPIPTSVNASAPEVNTSETVKAPELHHAFPVDSTKPELTKRYLQGSLLLTSGSKNSNLRKRGLELDRDSKSTDDILQYLSDVKLVSTLAEHRLNKSSSSDNLAIEKLQSISMQADNWIQYFLENSYVQASASSGKHTGPKENPNDFEDKLADDGREKFEEDELESSWPFNFEDLNATCEHCGCEEDFQIQLTGNVDDDVEAASTYLLEQVDWGFMSETAEEYLNDIDEEDDFPVAGSLLCPECHHKFVWAIEEAELDDWAKDTVRQLEQGY